MNTNCTISSNLFLICRPRIRRRGSELPPALNSIRALVPPPFTRTSHAHAHLVCYSKQESRIPRLPCPCYKASKSASRASAQLLGGSWDGRSSKMMRTTRTVQREFSGAEGSGRPEGWPRPFRPSVGPFVWGLLYVCANKRGRESEEGVMWLNQTNSFQSGESRSESTHHSQKHLPSFQYRNLI